MRIRKVLCLACMFCRACTFCRAGLAAQDSDPGGGDAGEIIVAAPRGSASGGIAPLLDIAPAELDSYGADTLSDLVDALRPLTRSSRSDQMAVVLINGYLAGQTEFDTLPREAIERVEVLPESVALQYGFSENQRVLNFILREHYRALPVRLIESGATEGGNQAFAADSSLVRLEDKTRATLLASVKDSAWLRESDRGIDLRDSAYRTLQPEKQDMKIAGTLSRSIDRVTVSVEASFDAATAKSLQGLSATSSAPGALGQARALQQTNPERTSRIATQFTGIYGNFVWGATAYYLHVESRSSSDTGVDGAGDTLSDRTRSAFDAGNLQLSLSGRAASLPAGPLIANAKLTVQYQGFGTRDTLPGAAPLGFNLVRTVRSGSVNASVPVANHERGVLPALGEISATFNAAVDDVSNVGALVSTSYGFDWKPIDKVHLDAIYTQHRTAPTLQQLRSPPIVTPNLEMFDFVTGQTAYVTQITGGDLGLSETDDRVASVGVSLGPIMGKTVFSAHYERHLIHNAIGALPPTTADVELAFPERYLRGADGRLVEVDNRWVNLQRETVDDLKWGINVWVPLGAALPNSMPNRFEVSLFDTWYLHDTTLIKNGIPQLDLLNGAPSDVTGGQPRHKVEFHTLVHRDGLGVLLAAAWRSPTVVGSGDPAAPDPIFFSALATADLRVFADLQRFSWTSEHPFARGARVSIAITNVFDRRQTVRDATGMTPSAFLPGYLDPPGRLLALNLRKIF